MPELPEVEVLVRHLGPLLKRRTIRAIEVRREKVLRPTSWRRFQTALQGAQFLDVSRRGKYLVFTMQPAGRPAAFSLLGHLGMTGRMYVQPVKASLPKHAAVILSLGRERFVFEDTRYFGRLTLDTSPLRQLGPEPLDGAFTADHLGAALSRSAQAIKVKLLDQSLVAGVGNIYASEALFLAGISPRRAASRLSPAEVTRLWQAVRAVLAEAIECGSTIPLDHAGNGARNGLFYFGQAPTTAGYYEERLRVYDRAGRPCPRCGAAIKRLVQAGRSTYFCPRCQRGSWPRECAECARVEHL